MRMSSGFFTLEWRLKINFSAYKIIQHIEKLSNEVNIEVGLHPQWNTTQLQAKMKPWV